MTRSWLSTMLRRAALTVMVVVALLAMPFIAGELLDDPGGVVGVLAVLGIAALLVGLVGEALRRPWRAMRLIALGLAAALAYSLLAVPLPALRWGPVVPVAALLLAVPAAVVGLRHAREAGALLVAAGLVPLADRVVAALTHGDAGQLAIGGSPAAIAVPLLLVGAMFLLAWAVGGQATSTSAGGPSGGGRHAADRRRPAPLRRA
jgi:hypothetical protein